MADSKGDGQAFPYGNHEHGGASGMTLRQYYAGQALTGLCANPGGPFQANSMSGWGIVNCTPDDVAAECLRLADALIDKTVPEPVTLGPDDLF